VCSGEEWKLKKKGNWDVGENYIIMRFIIYNIRNILLGRYKEVYDGPGL
jgi:hypothetical protein